MEKIFALLILFQFKHYVCDYPLQGKYMLGKFKDDWGFFIPLLCHCLIHVIGTIILLSLFTNNIKMLISLALLDGIIHFFMDRIKAGKNYLGRFKDVYKPIFWWVLGIDQMVHHLTHYVIIYLLLTVC